MSRCRWRRSRPRSSSQRERVERSAATQLVAEYEKPEHGLGIREVAGGYKMATKAGASRSRARFVKNLKPPLKLSLPALETLAVIAYKQPVTAPEIMEIRGVQGAGVLKTLLDRKLIADGGPQERGRQADSVQDHQGVPGAVRPEGCERAADAEGVRGDPAHGVRGYGTEPAWRHSGGSGCGGGDSVEAVTEAPAEPETQPASEPEHATGARAGTGGLMAEERLQKILSQAGVASRRQAEQLIVEGRVTVNGAVITELGSKADLERDHIKVDGRLLRPPKHMVYIALNKPDCSVTTVSDPEGRDHGDGPAARREGARVSGGPPGLSQRRAAAAHQRWRTRQCGMSAATHVPKTYLVKANGTLTPDQERHFRDGVPLSGRRTLPAGLKLIREAENPWYEVRLIEGRNNQIRIMFKHFGRLVEKLKRVRIGPIDLGPLKPGQFRHLTKTK